MKKALVYGVCVVGVMVIGSGVGISTPPGEWYASLQKPVFTPPGWVFGPVWTVLYALIGWVGARKVLHGGERGLWIGQMIANLSWSPVFFGLHLPLAALGIICLMWGLIVAFIVREWRNDGLSARLFLPYAAWVTLATAVNAGVVMLN